jgi:HTH-type transcriptional regulator/antitoxin HigA
MLSELAVIKTNAQYRDYLFEIEGLVALDPDPSSPEGKRLELLALLVETYEKERYQILLPNTVDFRTS